MNRYLEDGENGCSYGGQYYGNDDDSDDEVQYKPQPGDE